MRKILLALFLAACSDDGDPTTVYDVAAQYAEHVCDYFEACGVEGTREDCLTDVLAGTCAADGEDPCSNWDEEWTGSPTQRDRCFEDLSTASCDDVATPPATCGSVL